MRTLSCIASLALTTSMFAQCTHDPVITPASLTLCPGDSAVLTTQTADSYQWYRNGDPILGAINDSLLVFGSSDAGSVFKVLVTLDSCGEMSPNLSIGGIAQIAPLVYWYGNALFSDTLGIHFCQGEQAYLQLQPPHDTNIQWYADSLPIAGENDDTLFVSANGNYWVTASYALCPNSTSQPSYSTGIVFEPVTQPQIGWVDTLLCADPPGNSYQWYINGIPVFGGNDQCISATFFGGYYTVDVDYGSPCQETSDPYLLLGVPDLSALPSLAIWPNPATEMVNVSNATGAPIGSWRMFDLSGRQMRTGSSSSHTFSIGLNGLTAGTYLLMVAGHAPITLMVM
ncbi:MAG: T9SS type A sorting domain-containing protein [Flavobacteriales bacterium]|nr:T9SS type A sorting domain-containing protein [Flavobacteriales bacterium]